MTVNPAKHIQVKALPRPEKHKWDAFIASLPEQNFFQLSDWFYVLADTYKHKLYLLVLEDSAGKIVGGFPLFLIKVPLLGSKLISTPYQTASGGPFFHDSETGTQLINAAIELGEKQKVDFVEIRNGDYLDQCQQQVFKRKIVPLSVSVSFLPDISFKTIRVNHQRDIKKAQKNGISVRPVNGLEEWKVFYDLLEYQHRLFASPGFGWAFFKNLYEKMPDKVSIRLAWKDDKCVSGILLFHHAKTVFYKQGATLEEHKKAGAAKLVMWDSMCWARESGFSHFNFGMSWDKMQSLISFKEGFGAQTTPVANFVHIIKKPPPDIGELYSGHIGLKKIWKALPLPLTKKMGGILSRWYC